MITMGNSKKIYSGKYFRDREIIIGIIGSLKRRLNLPPTNQLITFTR